MPQRIDTIWAWISSDEDGEGVLAGELMGPGKGMVPLIAADQARLDSIRNWAKSICNQSGMTATLVTFTTRTEIEEIHPVKR